MFNKSLIVKVVMGPCSLESVLSMLVWRGICTAYKHDLWFVALVYVHMDLLI